VTRFDLANVDTTPTDSRSQRSHRSSLTSALVAAGTQPKSSARDVVGGGPSRALPSRVSATEV
jgi:hypothetical protein